MDLAIGSKCSLGTMYLAISIGDIVSWTFWINILRKSTKAVGGPFCGTKEDVVFIYSTPNWSSWQASVHLGVKAKK